MISRRSGSTYRACPSDRRTPLAADDIRSRDHDPLALTAEGERRLHSEPCARCGVPGGLVDVGHAYTTVALVGGRLGWPVKVFSRASGGERTPGDARRRRRGRVACPGPPGLLVREGGLGPCGVRTAARRPGCGT